MNLHQAIQAGNTDKVINLINEGADIEDNSEYKNIPLHLAVYQRNIEIVDLLIYKGANIDATDKNGKTALHIAADNFPYDDETEIVNIIINNGANIDAIDKNGKTALHIAAAGKDEIVAILIDKDANTNALDKSGKTPIIYTMEWYIKLAKRYSWKEEVGYKCAMSLLRGKAKEFFRLKIQNDGWEKTAEYLVKQYTIVNAKSGSKKTTAQKRIDTSIKYCAATLFGIATTLKAKALLKIKISFFKYKEKDPYTKTTILLKGKSDAGFDVINNIITFAGFCDSPIDLTHIAPTTSKEIQIEKEPRDLSYEDKVSNLAMSINKGCNISE